jgi:hypothetical protein
MVMPHWSAENTAKLLEDAMQLDRYNLVRKQVGLNEQATNAEHTNQLNAIVQERAAVPG